MTGYVYNDVCLKPSASGYNQEIYPSKMPSEKKLINPKRTFREKSDFSIIITNFNRANFLARAIRSALNQFLLRRKVEVILVDDCSTDDSHTIWREFENSISIVTLEKNSGVATASNVGIEFASSEYIMRLDADDYLSNEACAHLGAILDYNTDIDFVYCDHMRVDVNGQKEKHVKLDTIENLYKHGAGVLFRKQALEEVGCYDEKLRNAEDFDLLHRMIKAEKKGYYLPIPLYRYYIHGKNMTLNKEREIYWDFVRTKHDI